MLDKLKYFIRSKVLPQRVFTLKKNTKKAALYLTFDDGPVSPITEELLTMLKRHNAKATFFVLGRCIEQSPELLQRMVDEGHSVANHTYSHPRFDKITPEKKHKQIDRTNLLIKKHCGVDCTLFRAPQGRWDMRLLFDLFLKKITAVHWSYDSEDFKKQDPSVIVDRFVKKPVTNGEIILFHDDDDRCISALDALIPKWQAQGYDLKALEN